MDVDNWDRSTTSAAFCPGRRFFSVELRLVVLIGWLVCHATLRCANVYGIACVWVD